MPQAVEDLHSIHDFISKDSPYYARLTVERIFQSVDILEEFPLAGRNVPERRSSADLRELVRPPYRIVYRLAGDAIFILTVFRSSQLIPML